MADDKKYMTINMGPQHPATHGVLRILLELDGEIVVKATPFIGYLHRGVEKLAEAKTYHQALTLTDRLDYTNGLVEQPGLLSRVQKGLCGIEVPKRGQYLRVILAELQRIAAHLIWIGTHALDIGAMTAPFLYLPGARNHPEHHRAGDRRAAHPELHQDRRPRAGGAARVRRDGKVLRQGVSRGGWTSTKRSSRIISSGARRTKNVARLSQEDAISYGVTGPVLRASGVYYDVRKAYPYSSYEDFDFEIPMGKSGDVFDRYDVRVREMRQSNRIIAAGHRPAAGRTHKRERALRTCRPPRTRCEHDMAALIRHFKLMEEGFRPPVGEAYGAIESPKGELGFYLVSDGTNKPFRFRIRPAFIPQPRGRAEDDRGADDGGCDRGHRERRYRAWRDRQVGRSNGRHRFQRMAGGSGRQQGQDRKTITPSPRGSPSPRSSPRASR